MVEIYAAQGGGEVVWVEDFQEWRFLVPPAYAPHMRVMPEEWGITGPIRTADCVILPDDETEEMEN